MPTSTSRRCKAVSKSTGDRCQNIVKGRYQYCSVHRDRSKKAVVNVKVLGLNPRAEINRSQSLKNTYQRMQNYKEAARVLSKSGSSERLKRGDLDLASVISKHFPKTEPIPEDPNLGFTIKFERDESARIKHAVLTGYPAKLEEIVNPGPEITLHEKRTTQQGATVYEHEMGIHGNNVIINWPQVRGSYIAPDIEIQYTSGSGRSDKDKVFFTELKNDGDYVFHLTYKKKQTETDTAKHIRLSVIYEEYNEEEGTSMLTYRVEQKGFDLIT